MRTIEARCRADAGCAVGLKAAAAGNLGGGVKGDAVCASTCPAHAAARTGRTHVFI
jgi:hypothetical protein